MKSNLMIAQLTAAWITSQGADGAKLFAKKAKVSLSLVQKVRCGLYVPKKQSTLLRIARVLKVKADVLLQPAMQAPDQALPPITT